MAERKRSRAQEEAEADIRAVLPGQAVALPTGETVMVRPWGARMVIHEVPAILARAYARLRSAGVSFGNAAEIYDLLPEIMAVASDEVATLVCHTTGMERAKLEELPATAYLDLVEAVYRQNEAFFVRFGGLWSRYRAAGGKSPGQQSQETSSEPGSA